MKKLIKNTAILATGLLMVTGCSGDFLDHTPTDSVDSGLARKCRTYIHRCMV